MYIDCYQSIVKDESQEQKEHQAITITVQLDGRLAEMFPPLEAYKEGEQPWYIDNINPDWVYESDVNEEKYNTYKNYLEILTLFQNNYFNINILGAITSFRILENTPILKWNESNWNQSSWSDLFVEEEDE